jgi:phage gpG-like protein
MKTINLDGFNPILENIIRNSIEENFAQEGRFGAGIFGGGNSRWHKSLRARKQSGKTLQDTGQLAASIQVKASSDAKITIEANAKDLIKFNASGDFKIRVGSNKKYAGIHQFGGTIKHPGGTPFLPFKPTKRKAGFMPNQMIFISKKKAEELKAKGIPVRYTKPHDIKMPARPYLVLQDEDLIEIRDKFAAWIGKQF